MKSFINNDTPFLIFPIVFDVRFDIFQKLNIISGFCTDMHPVMLFPGIKFRFRAELSTGNILQRFSGGLTGFFRKINGDSAGVNGRKSERSAEQEQKSIVFHFLSLLIKEPVR